MFAADADPNHLDPLQEVQRFYTRTSGFFDLTGKVLVADPRLVPGERTAVILIAGQSNGANSLPVLYTPAHARVHNVCIQNGGMYQAADPLLGCEYGGGCFATRLGDMLVDAGMYDRVILVPISLFGTSMEQWTGPLLHRFGVAASRARALGLTFTHVLWHQGESDNSLETPRAVYLRMARQLVAAMRAVGITAPVLFARACTFTGSLAFSAAELEIRGAQTDILDPALGIFPGPDTDMLGPPYRAGGVHFNAAGGTAVAQGFKAAMAAL